MEYVDETKTSLIPGKDDAKPMAKRAKPAVKANPSKVWMQAGIALLVLQVVTIAVLLRLGFISADGSKQTLARLEEQTLKTQTLIQESSRNQAAISDLEHEVTQLRRFISSQTAVDVLMLKILIIKPSIEPDLARKIASLVNKYARLHSEDADLVLALMFTESNFNPEVVSHKGAVGLMQVMPQWKNVLDIDGDLKNPETSIKYGLQILGFYREMYKETEMALTAYNRGPGPVDMALMREKDYRNGYAKKVLNVHERLKSMNLGKL